MDSGRSHAVSLTGTSRGYCALVTAAQRAQPGRGWLTEAAARIGSTSDLVTTAREVTDVAVPGFADVAAIFVPEPMLTVGGFPSHRAGQATVVRRLARLDKLAAGVAATSFAKCVCAVIDPSASACVIAQAGHHSPVLVLRGGATQVLELPPGLPLGLGAGSFEASRISLAPGTTLALYTDGLVESRARPLDQGITALRDALGSALARPRATLGSTCATVTQTLRQHGEDDMTLVLARVRQ